VSRLLAQPAPRFKLASSAGCHSDPWDVSRQMALPLDYPDSHPMTLAPETGEVSWDIWGFSGFYSSPKLTRIRRSPRVSSPAGKLSILRSCLVEFGRPSRDMPALGPNRLGAAPQPSAGVQLLRTHASQSLDLCCHRPVCRIVTSHRFLTRDPLWRPWWLPSRAHAWHKIRRVVAKASGTTDPTTTAPSPASLFFKCWGCSGSKAHSSSSSSSASLDRFLTMSAIRSPGDGGARGGGVPEKCKPGRPKGSRKKAVTVTTAIPSSASRHGWPPGSRNKKTLAALTASASGSSHHRFR
jgi:hypothetical protein